MNNISAYNTVCKNKKVSELFLGTIEVNWEFLKVNYVATCTEAVPLTFLEKMICGIIDIDGKTDINNLAKIMGLNVEDDVQNLKFQDKAETEILYETLRTLKQFGVISAPDDTFSCVEMTDLGKEYYSQGRKFKQGEQKGFTMYFDLTAGDHNKAKTLFHKISVDGYLEQEPDNNVQYSDENYVKLYAESQIPQYYSRETGNSFTDMSVKSRECLFKQIILAVIIDTFTGKYRFEVVDDGGINADYITEFVNMENNIEQYISLYSAKQVQVTESKSESQLDFEERIMQVQRDAEYAIFQKKPQDAVSLVEEYSKSPLFMEKENLYNYVKVRMKYGTVNNIYIHIPTLTNEDEKEIRSIAENERIQVMLTCGNLDDFDTSFGANVFVLKGNYSSSPILIVDNCSYRCENLIFSSENSNYYVDFLHRQDDESSEPIERIRDVFAKRYIPYELDQFEKVVKDEVQQNIVERIRELNNTEDLITFEESYFVSTGNIERLTALRSTRDNLLLELVQKYSGSLMEELENIRINTVLEEIMTLDDMEKAKAVFASFKDKLIPEQSKDDNEKYGRNGYVIALWNVIDSYEIQLENREKFLRQELLPKSYVIDTNIFVIFPKIMDYISRDDRIILSGKVLDELDKLKSTTSGIDKKNVREAIREINYMHNMKRVYFEFADTKLLPEDFEKNNADNMILSVALKFRGRNPFVISNDINFQNRAVSLGIPYKEIKDIVPAEVYEAIKTELAKRKSANEIEIKKSTSVKSDYSITDKRGSSSSVYKSKRDSYENNRRNTDESQSYRSKDTKARDRLAPAKQIILNELVSKMISEEDPAAPIQDGDIRNEFIRITKVPIKLNLVRQAREDQGIPPTKERKEKYYNKNK